MTTLLKWLVLTPLAFALALLAFLNRQAVPVILDPTGAIPWLRFETPLFAVMLVCGALGVVAGGLATWFSQGRHRRAARVARSEASRLADEMRRTREQAPSLGAPRGAS
jgi:hypothetical protein